MKRRKTPIDWPEPIAWKQTADHDWHAKDEAHTRIKRLTNRYLELPYDSYIVYRRGLYLGTRRSLKNAKTLADSDPRGAGNGIDGEGHHGERRRSGRIDWGAARAPGETAGRRSRADRVRENP